jgi:branched-chain amino acid transport system ATP-binding protein
MSLLELIDINVYIGNLHILRGISFNLEAGEVIGLVGPNGAGKTSTLKTIIGLLPLRSGKILYDGEDISHLPIKKRVEKNIGYSPEDRRLIYDLTVKENILLPCWVSSLKKSIVEKNLEIVYKIFPEIKEFSDRKAGYLSGGQQKMVSIARAIITMPKLLLLDEPFEGLAPMLVKRLLKSFKEIKDLGITMIIAESNPRDLKHIANKIVYIERGRVKEVVQNA